MTTNETQRKILMQRWQGLPEPRISWESFKRLARSKDVNQAVEHAVQHSIRLNRKDHPHSSK